MGTSDQYKVFDSILEWSPTPWVVLGPSGVPILLKSVFLETPCTFWHLDKYVWPFCQIHLETLRNKFDRNILWRNEYWAEEGTVWSEAWFTEKKKKEIQLLAKYWLGNNQINFNFKKVKNQCLIANSIGNNIKWDSQRMQRLKGEEFVITSLRLLHPTDVTQTVHIQI